MRDLQIEQEATQASWEAARGGAIGAVTWGIPALVAGILGNRFHPGYRGLTIQFKVYLQMCPMVLGGYIEADNRVRRFERRMCRERKRRTDQENWRRFDEEFPDPGEDFGKASTATTTTTAGAERK